MSSEFDARRGAQCPLEFCNYVLCRVQEGDEEATTLLYDRIVVGLRAFLHRRIPAGLVEDCLHNVYAIALKALQEGQVREPHKLPGFILTVARRQAAQTIQKLQHERNCSVPLDAEVIRDEQADLERDYAVAERIRWLREALLDLEPRQHEVLTRYYLHGQSTESICMDLQLTETQVRLTKSRAKAKLQAALRSRQGPLKAFMRRLGGGGC